MFPCERASRIGSGSWKVACTLSRNTDCSFDTVVAHGPYAHHSESLLKSDNTHTALGRSGPQVCDPLRGKNPPLLRLIDQAEPDKIPFQ